MSIENPQDKNTAQVKMSPKNFEMNLSPSLRRKIS